jgi:cyclopropane-fatty-acyl-phospholipid synthase
MAPLAQAIEWCERGRVPDGLLRFGMRQVMRTRLAAEMKGGEEGRVRRLAQLVHELRDSPIAIDTRAANAQHYEVPSEFFKLHLGACLKYSCCLYPGGRESLEAAEQAMLQLYADRALLADGQRILDLGCGWGSLSLWLAERYPGARIVGLSNSHGQRQFIEGEAKRRGLTNLSIVTGDVSTFEFDAQRLAGGFDRVVSIEMFEHMKNYAQLLAKIARWMNADGQLFVHIFAHRSLAYHFQDRDQSDWMTRYFFTGGIMPSQSLLLNFQDDVRLVDQWWVNGQHYERTANQWLERLDAARDPVLEVLASAYGRDDAARWLQRWRMFYMAVAELFGFAEGREWGVAHYRFCKRAS